MVVARGVYGCLRTPRRAVLDTLLYQQFASEGKASEEFGHLGFEFNKTLAIQISNPGGNIDDVRVVIKLITSQTSRSKATGDHSDEEMLLSQFIGKTCDLT